MEEDVVVVEQLKESIAMIGINRTTEPVLRV